MSSSTQRPLGKAAREEDSMDDVGVDDRHGEAEGVVRRTVFPPLAVHAVGDADGRRVGGVLGHLEPAHQDLAGGGVDGEGVGGGGDDGVGEGVVVGVGGRERRGDPNALADVDADVEGGGVPRRTAAAGWVPV